MKTLIFPGGMPRAIAYLADCKRRQIDVVGASSLGNDPCQDQYPAWETLPYITDEKFSVGLRSLLLRHQVTDVFSASPAVWDVLRKLLPQIAPQVSLVGESPTSEMLGGFRTARSVAEKLWSFRDFLHSDAPVRPRMTEVSFRALVHHAESIPGMCDHQKLLTLAEIARDAPPGDIVEIGSWWGKSAFLLSFLSRSYSLGNVLCVDPWSDSHLAQGDALVDGLSAEVSAGEAFDVFVANLLPYGLGHVNYLRLPSLDAASVYRTTERIQTGEFGVTKYARKIALLHIDGNHEENAVRGDTESWTPMVAPGGWIVFDDYKWPYGDGPRRAADAFLMTRRADVEIAFFSGGALFIKLCR